MKKFVRSLPVFFLCLMFCGLVVQAADKEPAKVKGLKVASAQETTITLKWKKTSGATGYRIYEVTEDAVKKIATTTKTSYTIKNLKIGKKYQFQVKAYRTVKGETYLSEEYSAPVSVTPKAKLPGVPTNFSVAPKGDKKLEVTWTKAENATGYEVYRYNKKTEKYKKMATTTSNSYVTKKLKVGTEYTFVVRSYRTIGKDKVYSAFTKMDSATPVKVPAAVKKVRTFGYKAKTRSKITVYNLTRKKNQTLAQGTIVYTFTKNKANKWIIARLTDGDEIKVKISDLQVPVGIEYDASKDYSTKVKEAYVNSQNLKSSTDYLIWISHYRARVNIFKGSAGKWKLIRTFKVAIGRTGSVKGIRKIYSKVPSGKYGATPIVYWSKYGNAFHTLLGASTGAAVSSGCIRCNTEDLWYMYNNIPVNTLVLSY